MRRLFHIIIILFIGTSAFAQVPEKVSYQAVIRDAEGTLITNKEQSINLSVLQGNESGLEIYTETHFTETNANGLVSLEIGSGVAIGDQFGSIDWKNGPYFIKTETTVDGATLISISELLSVPYALHAKDALKVNGLTVATKVPENAVFTDHQTAFDVAVSPIPRLDATDVQTALEKLKQAVEEAGDMKKTTFDSNNDSIVDNAAAVNGFTVGTSVPVDAVFTDNQKATEVFLSSPINIGGAEVKTVEEAVSRLQEEFIKLQKEITTHP